MTRRDLLRYMLGVGLMAASGFLFSEVFYPSGGGESPSLTIEALAIRTSEHIRDLARMGEL